MNTYKLDFTDSQWEEIEALGFPPFEIEVTGYLASWQAFPLL